MSSSDRQTKVKVDENLGQSHAALLREAGYEADTVFDENLSGTSDEALWEQVVEEDRLFITLDLDFSDVRRFPPGSHPGILLLRPQSGSRDAVTSVLERVLLEYTLEELRGCLVVADDLHTRIRRPPGTE
jgi:predicted nuclease of predicted toxin-antitoxin system